MLSTITWGQYLMAIGVCAVVYYLFVGVRFYRSEMAGLLKGCIKLKKKEAARNEDEEDEDESEEEQDHRRFQPSLFDALPTPSFTSAEEDDDALFNDAETASNEIKAIIKKADEDNHTEPILCNAISAVLKSFPSLKSPAFRVAINNLIENECNKTNHLSLDAETIGKLWG